MDVGSLVLRILELVITNILVLVGAVWLWRKNLKMMPKEIEKAGLENDQVEANIAEQMQTIASNAAAQVVEYQKAIEGLNGEISRLKKEVKDVHDLRKEVDKLRDDLDAYKAENRVLREWAIALVNQVSKYESPVPMPVMRKGDKDG